ncbi:MAG: isoprenylcysteine carboxylmethyltransferase family protein [Alphaproteobacteria bacterium]|nr:isoprenylcysteine carboxylmethyltransferase family protein [Alphaproteobacteria bacterium]
MAKLQPPFLLFIPPPILYAAFFGAGLALDRLVRWHPAWMESAPARGLAWLSVAAAVGFGLGSLCLFWFRSTTVIPHGQPARLITGGPFAVSRNPIYLALTVGYCGAAVLAVRAWPLVLLAGPLIVMQLVVIPFEERRMQAAFGQAYADYCRRVRRWL